MSASRLAIATWLLAWGLGACTTPAPEETGVCIGEETLKHIKGGKTRETWLRAVIGEPSSTSVVADDPGLSVLRYSTTQQTDQSFFDKLMGIPGERTVGTIYFIIRDGVVEGFWADGLEDWRMFGGGGDSGEKKDK